MRVLTIGTFDAFHVGHIELLQACRLMVGAHGGQVIVGVNDDAFTASFKKVRLRHSLSERMDMVAHSGMADIILPHWDRDYTPVLIDMVRPNVIAVGDDWEGKDYLGQLGVTQEWLDERRIAVVYVPRTTGVSSTQVRARLS